MPGEGPQGRRSLRPEGAERRGSRAEGAAEPAAGGGGAEQRRAQEEAEPRPACPARGGDIPSTAVAERRTRRPVA